MLNINIVFVSLPVLVLALLGMILFYAVLRSQQRIAVRKSLIDKYASAQDLNDLDADPRRTPPLCRIFLGRQSSPERDHVGANGNPGGRSGRGVWGIGALTRNDPILASAAC